MAERDHHSGTNREMNRLYLQAFILNKGCCQMKKIVPLVLIFVMVVSVLAGCADGKARESKTNEPKQLEEIQKSGNAGEKTGTATKGAGDVVGQYVGQIDANSVEIEINGEPKVFRTTDLKQDLSGFATKDWVRISYTENEYGQFVLKGIQIK